MNEGISTEANLSHASFFTFATYTVHCYCRVTAPFSNMRTQLRRLISFSLPSSKFGDPSQLPSSPELCFVV